MNSSKTVQTVVALIVGSPNAQALWTLRALATLPDTQLHVVKGDKSRGSSIWKHAQGLARRLGVVRAASRALGNRTIRKIRRRERQQQLDKLFDGATLRRWWEASDIAPIPVPHLNHRKSRRHIEACAPDLIVRVSGGLLEEKIFSLARQDTLNIHHGRAPQIRGIWSIPWGIVENRPEWIGATVHVIDEGIDTGAVLWRGAPQITPGDTGTTLTFRVHLEAVRALCEAVRAYGQTRERPSVWEEDKEQESTYRTAPGLSARFRYWRLGEGARARVTLLKALQ